MKVLIYGAGYVGLANMYHLNKYINITITDIKASVIKKLNQNKNPIDNSKITFNFNVVSHSKIQHTNFDLFLLALPTDLDYEGKLQTDDLVKEIKKIREKSNKDILIRSTIPIGFIKSIEKQHKNIHYMPEFLSELQYKNEFKPYINIIGSNKVSKNLKNFLKLIKNTNIEFVKPIEAEFVKIVNNTWLASRITLLNEIESLVNAKGIDFNNIKNIISKNPFIGTGYLKNSIAFSGYCLPKDSQYLSYEFQQESIHDTLIGNINVSNDNRKKIILKRILNSKVKKIYIDGLGFNFGQGRLKNSARVWLAQELSKNKITIYTKMKGYQKKLKLKNIIYDQKPKNIKSLQDFILGVNSESKD